MYRKKMSAWTKNKGRKHWFRLNYSLSLSLSCSDVSVLNQPVLGEITVSIATQLIAKLLMLWVPWQQIILHYIGVMSLPVMLFCVCYMQYSFYVSTYQPRLQALGSVHPFTHLTIWALLSRQRHFLKYSKMSILTVLNKLGSRFISFKHIV